MIRYTSELSGIAENSIVGFFEGWPHPPSPTVLYKILESSYARVLAIDTESTGAKPKVVGLITAISDGVLSASIPLLEVHAAWRGQGIGRELVNTLLEEIGDLYMVDLVCDENVRPFYESLDFLPARAMVRRHYDSQSGRVKPR